MLQPLVRALTAPSVTLSVTTGAECNQILRHIAAELAPRPDVMNLQLLHGTAVLATPAISFQHTFSNLGVFFWVQFESGLLMA
jgi:hypothetical protein